MHPVCTTSTSLRFLFFTSSTNERRTGLAPAAIPHVAIPTTILVPFFPLRSIFPFASSLIFANSAKVFIFSLLIKASLFVLLQNAGNLSRLQSSINFFVDYHNRSQPAASETPCGFKRKLAVLGRFSHFDSKFSFKTVKNVLRAFYIAGSSQTQSNYKLTFWN